MPDSDIVERLLADAREVDCYCGGDLERIRKACPEYKSCTLTADAAAEITRLRAEVEALRERVTMAAKHLENAGLHEEGTAVRQALQEKPDDK